MWSETARSFLIDSIVRWKPIPKIFIRQTIDPKTKQSLREVVDGQQRLSAILDFINDKFKISKIHNERFGGKTFSMLTEETQTDILKYEIAADLLINLPDEEILEIFSRLNTYTVVLKNQERLNAKYVGEFKQTSYQLWFEFNKFFIDNWILTPARISRMEDAELTSELLIGILEGIQSKKSIESFYKKYDEYFPDKEKIIHNYKDIMDTIGSIFNWTLKSSNFSKTPLFYSLFLAVYDILYWIPKGIETKKTLNKNLSNQIKIAVQEIDAIWKNTDRTKPEQNFLDASNKATSDIKTRNIRHEFITNKILFNAY